MEQEYTTALREHVATLAEELEQLHQVAQRAQGLDPLLYRAAERNLQLLTEACIGIAKRRLKALGAVVPSEARQAFAKLQSLEHETGNVPWNKVVGLRNALVHDYLNLDADIVVAIIHQGQYRSLIDFAYTQLGK
nr:DUF86 domain-containing protein [uncultured Halomonas sp.]